MKIWIVQSQNTKHNYNWKNIRAFDNLENAERYLKECIKDEDDININYRLDEIYLK